MKKKYEKPVFVQENFLLSEHIAACTPGLMNNLDVTLEDIWGFSNKYFNADIHCTTIVNDGDSFNFGGTLLCYHTSADGGTIFSS